MSIHKAGDILLGKYRIESQAGAGEHWEVYQATHIGLNAVRALKVLRRWELGANERVFERCRRRFELEARLGALVNHPHIVRVYDLEVDAGGLVLAMEFGRGGSLAGWLQGAYASRQSLHLAHTMRLASELAQGLAALHDAGIVHRDLTPAHILFGSEGAKIGGLGLAQTRQGSPAPHAGDPAYRSPEQEAGTGLLSPAADVYSLGVMLFEAMTLHNPKELPPGTLLRQYRPDAPEHLERLLADMLQPDARRRPANGEEVLRRLSGDGGRTSPPAPLPSGVLRDPLQGEGRQESPSSQNTPAGGREDGDAPLTTPEAPLQDLAKREMLPSRPEGLKELERWLDKKKPHTLSRRSEALPPEGSEAEITAPAEAPPPEQEEALTEVMPPAVEETAPQPPEPPTEVIAAPTPEVEETGQAKTPPSEEESTGPSQAQPEQPTEVMPAPIPAASEIEETGKSQAVPPRVDGAAAPEAPHLSPGPPPFGSAPRSPTRGREEGTAPQPPTEVIAAPTPEVEETGQANPPPSEEESAGPSGVRPAGPTEVMPAPPAVVPDIEETAQAKAPPPTEVVPPRPKKYPTTMIGEPATQPPPSPPRGGVGGEVSAAFCPACGRQIPVDSVFCAYCGERLGQAAPPPAPERAGHRPAPTSPPPSAAKPAAVETETPPEEPAPPSGLLPPPSQTVVPVPPSAAQAEETPTESRITPEVREDGGEVPAPPLFAPRPPSPTVVPLPPEEPPAAPLVADMPAPESPPPAPEIAPTEVKPPAPAAPTEAAELPPGMAATPSQAAAPTETMSAAPAEAAPLPMPLAAAPPAAAPAPTPRPAPAQPRKIERHGRVEYFDQMDKDVEYPLRVGLLSLPHLEGVTPSARVRMEPVAIPAQTAEPVVRVVPSSTFLRISPAARELRASKDGDAFTTFKIMPVQVPKTLSSTCELEIDFEYRSAVIHTMRIPVRVIEKRRFGPVSISHRYWLPFGLVGAVINLLTIISGLIQFFNYMPAPIESAVYTGGFTIGSFILVLGYILWRGAGRRRSRNF